MPLFDLFHVFASSLLALTLESYHTAAPFKRHLLSNSIRQPAQLLADALGLFLVVMHDGMFKQGVKSLDRLYRVVSPRHRHSLYSTIYIPQMGPLEHPLFRHSNLASKGFHGRTCPHVATDG